LKYIQDVIACYLYSRRSSPSWSLPSCNQKHRPHSK